MKIHELPPAGPGGYYSDEQEASAKQEAEELLSKRKELVDRRDQSHMPDVRADLTATIWDIDHKLSQLHDIYEPL